MTRFSIWFLLVSLLGLAACEVSTPNALPLDSFVLVDETGGGGTRITLPNDRDDSIAENYNPTAGTIRYQATFSGVEDYIMTVEIVSDSERVSTGSYFFAEGAAYVEITRIGSSRFWATNSGTPGSVEVLRDEGRTVIRFKKTTLLATDNASVVAAGRFSLP